MDSVSENWGPIITLDISKPRSVITVLSTSHGVERRVQTECGNDLGALFNSTIFGNFWIFLNNFYSFIHWNSCVLTLICVGHHFSQTFIRYASILFILSSGIFANMSLYPETVSSKWLLCIIIPYIAYTLFKKPQNPSSFMLFLLLPIH